MVMLKNSIKIRGRAILTILIILSFSGCFLDDEDISPNQRHPCEEDMGVWIREPTSDIEYSVSKDPVRLYGITAVEKHWYDCFPCEPDLDLVRVMVANETTGDITEANEWLRLGILGYTHYWDDYVTLTPGLNNINATLYYNNVKDGYDCIAITYIQDVVPPSIPADLITEAISSSEITLNWLASTDDATTDDASIRYRIYQDGVYLYTVSERSNTNSGLNADRAYCYTVSAIDTASNESLQSNISCSTTFPL